VVRANVLAAINITEAAGPDPTSKAIVAAHDTIHPSKIVVNDVKPLARTVISLKKFDRLNEMITGMRLSRKLARKINDTAGFVIKAWNSL
jgi:hypothetical protein